MAITALYAFLYILAIVLALFIGRSIASHSKEEKRFKSIFESIWKIERSVLETIDFDQATKQVVNIVLEELGYINFGYEIIVLTMVDPSAKGLRRIAISHTDLAGKFLKASPVPFNNIIIPFSAKDNLCNRAIKARKMFVTQHVSDVLEPALSKDWVENFQNTLGIKTTIVYPVIAKQNILGTLIFSLSKEQNEISEQEWSVLDSFVGSVGIALYNALLFKRLNEATDQLTNANGKLKALDKLKNEFVSVASHELRTPMTAIKSYLWMALEGKGGNLNDKQKYYIERGYNSVDRLIRLVNDMLNISRIESGKITIDLQSADLVVMTQEVVDEVLLRANELGVTIEMQKPDSLPRVLADPDKIKEVLFNLIGNSLKFTPKGGTITISFSQNAGFVETSVTDTGAGIATEDKGKLFQKFGLLEGSYVTNQTSTSMGTGLGLFICRSIIELHHGQIKADSEGRGKGSTFSFTLKEFKESDLQTLKKEKPADKDDPVNLIHVDV
jgi:signal transduction histidine kinase